MEKKDDRYRTLDSKDFKTDSKSVDKPIRYLDEEAKMKLKWLGFAKSTQVFGFDHLGSKFDLPKTSQKCRGISICIEGVEGWKLSPSLLNNDDDDDIELFVQLSLSMFHLGSGSFFGSTWMGPKVALSDNMMTSSGTLQFEYSEIIYLLTRLLDPSCVIVAEIVVTKINHDKSVPPQQFGAGWTILNVFSHPNLPDISEGEDKGLMLSSSLLFGSPRDLLFLQKQQQSQQSGPGPAPPLVSTAQQGQTSSNPTISTGSPLPQTLSSIREIPNSALHYSLFGHKKLLRIIRFVSENEAIGRFSIIPGLRPKPIVLPGETRTSHLCCLGDQMIVKPQTQTGKNKPPSGAIEYISVPAKPMIQIPIHLSLHDCQLMVKDRLAVEQSLLSSLSASNITSSDSSSHSEPVAPSILGRNLRISVHNGHVTIGGEGQVFPLDTDDEDPNLLKARQEILEINGYTPHSFMVLSFSLEYEIGFPLSQHGHMSAKALLKATVHHQKGLVQSSVTLGTSVLFPHFHLEQKAKNKELWNPASTPRPLSVSVSRIREEKSNLTSSSPTTSGLKVGMEVEANFESRGRWLSGTVSKDWGDGTFEIKYQNGEIERRVEDLQIRVHPSSQVLVPQSTETVQIPEIELRLSKDELSSYIHPSALFLEEVMLRTAPDSSSDGSSVATSKISPLPPSLSSRGLRSSTRNISASLPLPASRDSAHRTLSSMEVLVGFDLLMRTSLHDLPLGDADLENRYLPDLSPRTPSVDPTSLYDPSTIADPKLTRSPVNKDRKAGNRYGNLTFEGVEGEGFDSPDSPVGSLVGGDYGLSALRLHPHEYWGGGFGTSYQPIMNPMEGLSERDKERERERERNMPTEVRPFLEKASNYRGGDSLLAKSLQIRLDSGPAVSYLAMNPPSETLVGQDPFRQTFRGTSLLPPNQMTRTSFGGTTPFTPSPPLNQTGIVMPGGLAPTPQNLDQGAGGNEFEYRENFHVKTVILTDSSQARPLTRGARSRLQKHGYQDLLQPPSDAGLSPGGLVVPSSGPSVVDVELESRDPLPINDITIQFAAFRGLSSHPICPRAIYLSFQFYTCRAVRTESMRIIPLSQSSSSPQSQSHLLLRDDVHARNDPPLALRFTIDNSSSTPFESTEFAEYLAWSALHVDVWDADSLHLLGSIRVPLRGLMRQGAPITKSVLECDIVNSEDPSDESLNQLFSSSSSLMFAGQGSHTNLLTSGAQTSRAVGALQIVMTNIGRPSSRGRTKSQPGFNYESEGLNWRLSSSNQTRVPISTPTSNSNSMMNPTTRPRNSVRAKPLSESAPGLSHALRDIRNAPTNPDPMRSMVQGERSSKLINHALTYDEVMLIFKQFRGSMKATVQYAGPLTQLLDIPSSLTATRKLLTVFKSAGSNRFKNDLKHFSSVDGRITRNNLTEFLTAYFEKFKVKYRREEAAILSRTIAGDAHEISLETFYQFLRDEMQRQDWIVLSKKFRRLVENVRAKGFDAEALISSRDSDGDDHLNERDFEAVLRDFLRISGSSLDWNYEEMGSIVRHFSRVPPNMRTASHMIEINSRLDGPDSPALVNDPNKIQGISLISTKEVMAFLGLEYAGNISSRLGKFLMDQKERVFKKDLEKELSPSEIELFLGELGCYSEFSHEQIRSLIASSSSSLPASLGTNWNKLSLSQLFSFIGVSDLIQQQKSHLKEASKQREKENLAAAQDEDEDLLLISPSVTASDLLRILLERIQDKGASIDASFRLFDKDGNGQMTKDELAASLTEMKLFNHLPDWRKQLPELVSMFDKNGDGSISLSEFFQYLGIKDYVPNIIQKMTKVFAQVKEKNISLSSIFQEFDKDQSGEIDASELMQALQSLGTFEEVSMDDVHSLMSYFDKDGNGKVSKQEFVSFFETRVSDLLKNSLKKKAYQLLIRFHRIMLNARSKGVSPDSIFDHFDSDRSGQLTADELGEGLKKMPNFQDFSAEEMRGLVGLIDEDNNGTISKEEFRKFSNSEMSHDVEALMKNDKGKPPIRPRAPSTSGQSDSGSFRRSSRPSDTSSFNPSTAESLLVRFGEILRGAESRGQPIEVTFDKLDTDRSGGLSVKELSQGLRLLPFFKSCSDAEVQYIVDRIDENKDGDISRREFSTFFSRLQGKDTTQDRAPIKKRTPSMDEGESKTSSSRDKSPPSVIPAPTSPEERFLILLQSASRDFGSIEKMVSYLDADGDGLIHKLPLTKLLEREVEKSHRITEEEEREISRVLSQLAIDFEGPQKGSVNVVSLLKFVQSVSRNLKAGLSGAGLGFESDSRGRYWDVEEKDDAAESKDSYPPNKRPDGKEASLGGRDDSDTLPDYSFSADPEIRSLEKKIRNFGQSLAKRGVDVDAIFRSFDKVGSGIIRRTDFIEAMSQMGMYVLEEGRVMHDVTQNSDEDVRRQQMRQVHRIKGQGPDYLASAAQIARKVVMTSGNEGLSNGPGPGKPSPEGFQDHIESMSLVKWYRQSQKHSLLQKVLSHSLSTDIHLFPRFGKTLFFEFPLTNPFNHEERFLITLPPQSSLASSPHTSSSTSTSTFSSNQSELRIVTDLEEWIRLRETVKPCIGELGETPTEAEMFDFDLGDELQGEVERDRERPVFTANSNRSSPRERVIVCLLPNETLYIPVLYRSLAPRLSSTPSESSSPSSYAESKSHKSASFSPDEKARDDDLDPPSQSLDLKVTSLSHGHLLLLLRLHLHPRPTPVHRTLHFFEPENTVMKRRLYLAHTTRSGMGGRGNAEGRYFVCCVEESDLLSPYTSPSSFRTEEEKRSSPQNEPFGARSGAIQSRVVVEWGPSLSPAAGCDLFLRFRCGAFPSLGSFFLLLYSDSHHHRLCEVWQVFIHTRLRLDSQVSLGSASHLDVIVKGDRMGRRVRLYRDQAGAGNPQDTLEQDGERGRRTQFPDRALLASPPPPSRPFPSGDTLIFSPPSSFQLVPNTHNRLSLSLTPRQIGAKRILLNLVDEDSKELLSSWLLLSLATPPHVSREYEIQVPLSTEGETDLDTRAAGGVYKKIVFRNPWNIPRRFHLSTSDETVMRSRDSFLDVSASSSSHLRLHFLPLSASLPSDSSLSTHEREEEVRYRIAQGEREGERKHVYLFLSDEEGRSEDCFLFHIRYLL